MFFQKPVKKFSKLVILNLFKEMILELNIYFYAILCVGGPK